jgi:hypothetical protein
VIDGKVKRFDYGGDLAAKKGEVSGQADDVLLLDRDAKRDRALFEPERLHIERGGPAAYRTRVREMRVTVTIDVDGHDRRLIGDSLEIGVIATRGDVIDYAKKVINLDLRRLHANRELQREIDAAGEQQNCLDWG